MFSSDWAFGYGKYWKQFFCSHQQVIFEFSIPKEARSGIEVIAKCQRCDKEMGKHLMDFEKLKKHLEYFKIGTMTFSL